MNGTEPQMNNGDDAPTVTLNPAFANAARQAAAPPRRKKAKGLKRQKKVEDLYRAAIKAGEVKIIRKKGRPPEIVWL